MYHIGSDSLRINSVLLIQHHLPFLHRLQNKLVFVCLLIAREVIAEDKHETTYTNHEDF